MGIGLLQRVGVNREKAWIPSLYSKVEANRDQGVILSSLAYPQPSKQRPGSDSISLLAGTSKLIKGMARALLGL